MGKFEKSYVIFTLLYSIIYGFYFFNSMSTPEDTFDKILPFHLFGMALNLGFIIILIRDIVKRTFKNPNSKVLWSILIIIFWPVVFIYLPKYGFRPRNEIQESGNNLKYIIGFLLIIICFFGFMAYSMFSVFSNFEKQEQDLTSLIFYEKNDEILERFERGLVTEKEMQGTNNWSPLHTAVSNNRIGIVKILIENGNDINLQTKCNGNTPLHIAAKNGYYGVVKILLEAGAEKSIVNDENKTPYDLAIDGEYSDTAFLLRN